MLHLTVKEYDVVHLKDGREGTVVGVYDGGNVFLVDLDYSREQLRTIDDPTEFVSKADIEKIIYVS